MCDSEPLSTASLAKKRGYLPRIVRVMNFTNALSHKLATWNERGLIRDLCDVSFMINNFEIYPDLIILQDRLNNVSYRYKGVSGEKQMTFLEFTKKLSDVVTNLTQISIEAELKDYFTPEELPGLDKKIKIGIHRIIDFLQSHT